MTYFHYPKPLAILGGTFDPPHIGHLTIAKKAQQELDAEVVFMPCSRPHKTTNTPAFHRWSMMVLFAQEHPNFLLSDCEMIRNDSFTIQTLQLIATQYPQRELYWLFGSDNLASIETWENYQDIPQYAKLIFFSRGNPLPLPDTYKQFTTSTVAKCKNQKQAILQLPLDIPISSTQIRKLCADKADTSQWLSPSVANYIKQHRLYS